MSDDTISKRIDILIAHWGRRRENLLQILIGIQQSFLHIPSSGVDRICDELGCTRAEVASAVGFYSFLHSTPRGRFDFLFSDNIIERMQGNQGLAAQLVQRLGTAVGETRDDGKLSLAMTSCTGMSDQGPAALINGYALTKLTAERIGHIADLIETETPLSDWPRDFFSVSDNIRRKDLMLNTDLKPGTAITKATEQSSESLLCIIDESGLRGRGGAGFRTGLKWRLCAQTGADDRVVVCNADEGEPGTFKDRVILQSYADRLFEGMTVCAATIGAAKGFLYLRGEYRYLLESLEETLRQRREQGLLGRNILGKTGFDFDIEIHLGAGAYICGEESALIESLEGKRGNPRIRPPYPVTRGYMGLPTVVNNVETFVAAAMIVANGVDWFRAQGTTDSAGTKLLSISGDCDRPGVYEYPYGVTIKEILADCGANYVQAVQVAGPAGQLIPPSEFDHKIAFEDVATGGSFMIFSRDRDLLDVVKNFADFFVHESCGFCTPCRIGTSLIQKRLEKVYVGHSTTMDLENMRRIGTLMREASHCGLGQTAANPILESLAKFPHIYEPRLRTTSFEPAFDLNAALDEAREVTGRDDPGAFLQGGGV